MHPTVRPTKWAVTTATACAVALAPGTVPAASASPTPARAAATASTPTCATSGLVVWLDTQGNGAAGHTYFDLELTNLSGHRCTLFGYPGVSAVDIHGHQLGRAASRNPAHTPNVVTLPNTSTATVVLSITDVTVYGSSTCGYVTAAGLRAYPPGQTASKVVPFPFTACKRNGPVYLSAEAVQTGAEAVQTGTVQDGVMP
jgi:hypothetical protein